MSCSKEKHYPKIIGYILKRAISVWFAYDRDVRFPEMGKQYNEGKSILFCKRAFNRHYA